MPVEQLSKRILTSIMNFTEGTGGEGRLPVLEIVPEGNFARTDNGNNIFREGANLFGIFTNKFARSTLTLNPAPHVPGKIPAEVVRNAALRRFGFIPNLGNLNEIGTHLVVWWQKLDTPPETPIEEQTGSRCDMLGLAQLPETDRKNYFSAISQQIENGVNLMAECLGLSEDGLRNLRVYGLFGHATWEERNKFGLSRGSQSAPDGHLNIVYLPEDVSKKTNPEAVTAKEMVKQIGPWDTVVDNLFGSGIQRMIQNTALSRLNPRDVKENNPIYVTRLSDYTTSSDFSHMNFFEGYKLNFGQSISIERSLAVLTDILKKGSDLYSAALSNYEAYFKNSHNPDRKKAIFDNLKTSAKLFGFGDRMAGEFANFVFSIKPTHGQLNKWINEIEADIHSHNAGTDNSEISADNLAYLKKVKRVYQRIAVKLHATGGRESLRKHLQHVNNLSPLDADLLLSVIEDRFKLMDEKVTNISSIMSPFLSGSYMLDYTRDNQGHIMVKGISLSTRLGTDKGVVEDLGGYVIHRATGI